MSIKISDNDGGFWLVDQWVRDIAAGNNRYEVWHMNSNNHKGLLALVTNNKCNACSLLLPDNFKTIAVLHSLPIEAEMLQKERLEKYKMLVQDNHSMIMPYTDVD